MKTVDPATGGDFLGTAAWYEREANGIEFPFPKLFGRLGDEYDKRYGLKDEHLAHIAAVNYSNARRNPLAQTRNWYMSESHAAPAKPLQRGYRRPHQGLRLLASDRRRGGDFPGIGEVRTRICAAAPSRLRKDPADSRLGPSHGADRIRYQDGREPGQSLCPAAYAPGDTWTPLPARASAPWNRSAGIETHDCFTTSEYMAIDHFGHHQAGRVVEGGRGGRDRTRRADADQSQRRTDRGGPSGGRDRCAAGVGRLQAGHRARPAITRSRAPGKLRCSISAAAARRAARLLSGPETDLEDIAESRDWIINDPSTQLLSAWHSQHGEA